MSSFDSKKLILKVDPVEFKALFKTKPYLHALAIAQNWVIIFAAIFMSIQFPSIFVYSLAIIIIGARMHGLGILAHDAAHFRFLKNRKWNDLVSNFCTTYPIFISLENYRQNHLAHHQHLNTDDDPDWIAKLTKREYTFPKTKREFLITVVSYFVLYQGLLDALWFLKRLNSKDKREKSVTEHKGIKLAYYLTIFIALTLFGVWKYFLLFWVIPYFSTFFMFQYIRSVAEHFGELAYEDDLSSSRTVKATLLEQLLVAPHNVGYHLEHHLYPGVPFYNLPKLHNLLMVDAEYNEKAHITQGYAMGLMQELGKV